MGGSSNIDIFLRLRPTKRVSENVEIDDVENTVRTRRRAGPAHMRATAPASASSAATTAAAAAVAAAGH